MEISNERAEYLLKIPKKIILEEQLQNSITVKQNFPFHERFNLMSEKEDDIAFLWEFKQSKKNTVKVNFHYQDNGSKIGLLRLDYNSRHTNPAKILEFVPKKFHQYAGKDFENNEHHMHYYVQGYKPLAWAIPLVDDKFEIKELDSKTDFNKNFSKIIHSFAKMLNIETKITINSLLI